MSAPRLFPTPKRLRVDRQALAAAPVSEQIVIGSVPGLPADLSQELRLEAYDLQVDATGARIVAETPEGVLRARATIDQLRQPNGSLPYCDITDWPDFRYRCASDWLLNCEINRWAYDWGDGPAACMKRLKRKLDFCFAHKINQVWFEGFGWKSDPKYAEFMRECNRYARARGIKLTFAGYGGGYGTSYQLSELYRCGYQGRVFINHRPWPNGPDYNCIGCDVPHSRRYGTCATNEGLRAAKVEDMRQFAEAVEPGFMYIHDIDTGGFQPSREAWLWRCDERRERWPSDNMTDPQGQAGAYADWFRQVASSLGAIRTGEYDAARDLTLIFVSPVYTGQWEPGQPELWDQEVEYFRLLSELIGPQPNLMFGLREQFYRADGSRKVMALRTALDEVGNGHGIHIIAFGGGDNYTSDDLCNLSGAAAGLYQGAHSVCLSNGGLHEEPVQVLNADFLWNGQTNQLKIDPGSNGEMDKLWLSICRGQWRPASSTHANGALAEVCRHLWGDDVGTLMHRARLCGEDAERGPVTHVWWTITREIRRLTGDYTPWNDQVGFEELAERFAQRTASTQQALRLAQQACALTRDEDVKWFARSLEVGHAFAAIIALTYEWRTRNDDTVRQQALKRIQDLSAHLRASFSFEATDPLGGDPGCWQETAELLTNLLS
ncbi:MAG: glycoside hydrolase family 20 zincin-like fold domain-containing protein [Armatimonadota bacterium]